VGVERLECDTGLAIAFECKRPHNRNGKSSSSNRLKLDSSTKLDRCEAPLRAENVLELSLISSIGPQSPWHSEI
jgi:hypothetical protein